MAEVLEPVLKVEKVNKRFGSFNALTDLTFSVEAGHVFGMVGENGSGKSTALRIVVGLEKADSGSISICGLDASEHPTEIYHYIGYVPDSFGLYENLLVQEYMTFFAEASGLEGYLARRRISHALEMVGLSGREGLYVDYLSSSMKQRLCIARAMLNYPRLLILDDPMKGIDLKNRFEEFIHERGANISLREGYGLTETVTVCSVNPEKECRSGSVGLPLPGIDMKIVKVGTEEEIPNGEKGEICISGPTVMKGYLNDPEATALAIHVHADGRQWIHSGDLGHRDEDGFFYFDQRIKRIIKVSGVPVFPTQIEKTLTKVEDVESACAIAIPHPYRLHVVKAYIVLKDRAATEEKKELVRQKMEEICKSDLIPYARPVEYEFREDLPKTKIGKIDYRALELEAQPPKEEKDTNA